MESAEFIRGLARLAEAVRSQMSDLTAEVYYDALRDQVGAEEWDRFTLAAVAAGRFRYFPTVQELLDALREFRGAPTAAQAEREAVDAYERVLACGTYTAEGGTRWDQRAVRERCGRAAAEAFMAAGGHHAFSTAYFERERREKFVAAYAVAVRDEPAARLLPAPGPVALLPPGEPPTRDEAGTVLERLAQVTGARPRRLQATRVASQEQWDRRRAELLEQAGRAEEA